MRIHTKRNLRSKWKLSHQKVKAGFPNKRTPVSLLKKIVPAYMMFSQFVKIFRNILTNIIIILTLVIIVLVVVKEAFNNKIILEPVSVPLELSQMGYTDEVLANNLYDQLREIQEIARNKNRDIKGIDTIVLDKASSNMEISKALSELRQPEMPNIKLPDTGISLGVFVQFLKKSLGIESKDIRVEIIRIDSKLHIFVRIGKEYIGGTSGIIKDLDKILLNKIAQVIYKHIQPLTLAAYYLANEEWDKCAEMISYSLENNNYNNIASVYFLRAVSYNDQRKFKKAISELSKIIEMNPNIYAVWANLSYAQISSGLYNEGLMSCEKAIKINSKEFEAWNNKAFALLELKKYREAISSFEKAIEIKPDIIYLYYEKAICHKTLGEIERTVSILKKVSQLDPTYRLLDPTYRQFLYDELKAIGQ